MQQPITRRDAYEPTASVVIDGRTIDVQSVSVDRALPDPLARAELRSAEAQIVAVDGPDVTTTVATPWDIETRWPPAKEAPANVSFDTGSGPVAALTGGRVTHSEGGTDDRPVYVEVLDQYQSLDQTISWGPVSDAMPSESEATVARYVSMGTTSITDAILRHCGWYSTPPTMSYTMLSVPAQGTMWPEVGTVTTSLGTAGAYPGWLNSPWGVGVSAVDALCTVGGNYTMATRGRVEVAAMTATRPGGGSSRMDVLSDAGALLLRMSWSETSGHVWVRGAGGTMVAVASVTRTDGLLYATIERKSSRSVEVTVRSGGNEVSSGTVTVDSPVTSSVIRQVRIVADSVSGGFLVATPATAGRLSTWTPNAVLYPRGANRNTLKVRHPVEGESCVDLLAQQCAAECATYWIDELGILRWWDLARLESQAVVATVTSGDEITREGFRWSNDPSTVKSRVLVKWQEPLQDRSWRTTVDLFQGSGQTVQPNSATTVDPIESWINVPDDEVWVMPDLTLSRADITTTSLEFNQGIGSFYGGVIPGVGSTPDKWAPGSGSLVMRIERVTDQAFKTSLTWSGAEQAVLRTLAVETASNLWRIRRDFDLPIIRGKAKYTFTKRDTHSTQSGPRTAPEHVIDAGFWIQRAEQAQYTADYAGARMTIQQPTISELPLVMAPGIQIGDVIEAVESHVSRLTIRGVVMRDSRTLAVGVDMSHKIAIRPTHVSRNGITWAEWSSMTPGTWANWASAEGGTWQAWGRNPLNE